LTTNNDRNAVEEIEIMRTKIGLLVGIGLIVLFTFVHSTAHVQSSRTAWEYKVLDVWSEQGSSKLGADGWELVAIDPIPGGTKGFFKRPKQ
jgi:hypothetical protein